MGKMEFRLAELAGLLRAGYDGDPDMLLTGVGTIDAAGAGELTFLANPKYEKALATTKASAVVIAPGVEAGGIPRIIAADPYRTFAAAVALFNPPTHPGGGVSDRAVIHPTAHVGDGATVMALAVVDEGASVGDRAVIYPGVYIGRASRVGKDTVIYPNVTVREGCTIGDRVIIQPGAVIGSDGFGFAMDASGHLKFPQIGTVEIEDDVEIGALTAVDRAALGKTLIGRGTKMDNLVQVGHNVVLGKNSIIVAQVGISGSTVVGDNVVLAGQVGVAGHIKIGDGAMIGAQSGVAGDVPPGSKLQGTPVMDVSKWYRAQALFKTLPEMRAKIKELERRLEELDAKSKGEDKK